MVLTLQQIVLSKNQKQLRLQDQVVLTLQQIVLSKNSFRGEKRKERVLTLQQIVLSKNDSERLLCTRGRFDFTTNCSF